MPTYKGKWTQIEPSPELQLIFAAIASRKDEWEGFETEIQFDDFIAKIRWNGNPKCPVCGSGESQMVEFDSARRGTLHRYICICRTRYNSLSETPLSKFHWSFKKLFLLVHKIKTTGYSISRRELMKITDTNSENTIRTLIMHVDGKRKDRRVDDKSWIAVRQLKRQFGEEKIEPELIELKKAQLLLDKEISGGLYKGGLTVKEYYKKNKERMMKYNRKKKCKN